MLVDVDTSAEMAATKSLVVGKTHDDDGCLTVLKAMCKKRLVIAVLLWRSRGVSH